MYARAPCGPPRVREKLPRPRNRAIVPETTHPSLFSRLRDPADHAAWGEFDGRYRDLILRYCHRRGLQRSDAEDVRQMVMLNLARQFKSFQYSRERGRFRDYLGRTVVNAIHRYFRRPRPEVDGLQTSVVAGLSSGEDGELAREWESEWMLHHYRIAMGTVRRSTDPKSIEVFEHLLAGETPDEVALAFDMKRDAVHKVKQRVRDRLKELVARQIDEEEDLDLRAIS